MKFCSDVAAVFGGSSPQSASTSRSTETAWPACRSRTASTAFCFWPPSESPDARAPDDALSVISALAELRLASVETHAHAYLHALRPHLGSKRALAVDRSRRCVVCPRERDEERISLSVDFAAPVRG